MDHNEDIHICLNCHVTILGIDNYVRHKKHECPVLKNRTSLQDKNNINQPAKCNNNIDLASIANIPAAQNVINHIITSNENSNLPKKPGISTNALLSHNNSTSLNFNTFDTPRPLLSPERYSLDIFHEDVDDNRQDKNGTSNFPSNTENNFMVSNYSSSNCNPVSTQHQTVESNILNNSISSITGSELHQTQKRKEKEKPKTVCEEKENDTQIPDAASVAEFFSSLELRIREPNISVKPEISTEQERGPTHSNVGLNSSSSVPQHSTTVTALSALPTSSSTALPQKEDAFEERLKNIKIANILTDLNFSSDSEGLPSDVEELLNFSDEEQDEQEIRQSGGKWRPVGHHHPPSGHSKGKWRPASGKLAAYGKHHGGKKGSNSGCQVSGKWRPGMMNNAENNTSGKWKSGQRVAHGQGKYGKLRSYKLQRLRGLTDSEDEQEKEIKATSDKKIDKAVTQTKTCEVCTKTFKSTYYLKFHLNTSYHKKRANKKTESRVKSIKCALCNKTISNKFNYARHLTSEHELKQETDSDNRLIGSQIQTLVFQQKAFQCRICLFYCETSDELDSHMIADDHLSNCSGLLGPLYCTRCKFKSDSNYEMVSHLKLDSHKDTVAKTQRPCVVKEYKTNLTCQKCNKVLSSLTKLSEHIQSAHCQSGKNKTVKVKGVVCRPSCEYCGLQCQSKASLEIHTRRKHTGEKPYICEICSIGFACNSDLQSHFQTDKHLNNATEKGIAKSYKELQIVKIEPAKKTPANIKCKYGGCLHKEHRIKDMKEHYKEKHSNGKRFKCDLCDYQDDHKSHWDKHVLTKRHIALAAAYEATNTPNNSTSSTSKEEHLKCSFCNIEFLDNSALHEHQVTHMITTEEELVQKEAGGDNLKYLDEKYHEFVKNLSENKATNVTCPESGCERKLKSKFVVEHLRTHTELKPFSCIYCEKSFHRGERLRAHLLVHFPKKLHSCKFCAKSFRDKSVLKQHLITNHPENVDFQPDYMCSECGFKCMTPTMLRVHMYRHSKEGKKRYLCPWQGCSMSFMFKSELNSHVLRHKKVKSFLCDLCGFAAFDKRHLFRHKRKHTGIRSYKCEYCTYSYFNSGGLKRHMKIHINARAYKCPYPENCDFSCNAIENIRKHVNCNSKHVSRDEYLYPCRHCNIGFKSQNELKDHVNNIHNIEVTLKDVSLLTLHPGIENKTAYLTHVPPGQKVNPVAEKYVAKKWKQNGNSGL